MGRRKNGEGSFREYHGKWQYRFSYRDEYNKLKSKSISAETKLECLEKAEAFLMSLEASESEEKHDVTIADIIKEKMDKDFAMNYSNEAGYYRNNLTLKTIKKHPIADIPIAEITSRQMELYLQSLTKYSNQTIDKIYQRVKAAFNIAHNKGIIQQNIMVVYDLRKPRSKKADTKVKALTRAEQQKFLEEANNYVPKFGANDYTAQLFIELYSGLRMGEINALTPDAIDLKNGMIKVTATVSVDGEGNPCIKAGAKTENGTRQVPISDTLRPILEKALEEMKPNPYNLVFYNHKIHQIITTSSVNNTYKIILRNAGVKVRGQHSLRHTFATRCIESGVQPVVLKTWLGHSDIHITLDRYADVFNELHNDSIKLLDNYLNEMK